ncbi:restriction endonuclease subunit S [Streptomyces sp. NPDC017556]|uniref:restriction endonuclease subunit S n=1 Tax=Streptomyces sp. NPDC017556 TaxID=3365002 RepID=UPI00378803FB
MSAIWKTVPLWSLVTVGREVVEPSDLGKQVVHYSIPVVDALGTGQMEASESIKSAKLLLRGGEVLISKLNPRKSRVLIVAKSDLPIVSSTEFVGLQTLPGLDARFLSSLLQSETVRQELDSQVQSVTRSHQRVSPEDVTHLSVQIPPLDEQRRIADFLDSETDRIDRLAGLQQAVIARLKEREAAELDNAIDELASRSGTVPLRRFVWSVDQGISPQCEAVPSADDEWGVLKVSCLRPGIFNPAENKRLPDNVQPQRSSEVHEGDLLIARANTPQLVGSTAVVRHVRKKLLLSDKIFRVRLSEGMTPDFVATIARGSRIRNWSAAGSNGASQSMANIRFEEVKKWHMPAVQTNTQREFVEHISRGQQHLDALRPTVDRQLALLAERRQALITAAVTGQFDVSTASGRNVTDGV